MMASVPSMALGSPPLTGASTKSTPLAAQAAAIFCETSGLMELMSMIERAGLRAGENSVGAEDDFFDLRAVGEHGDNDFGARANVGVRCAALSAIGDARRRAWRECGRRRRPCGRP